jgi:CheY-like chemotaxis protein
MRRMRDATILVVETEPSERERVVRALAACTDASRVAGVGSSEAAMDYLLARGPHAARDARKLPRLLLVGLQGDDGLALLDAVRVTPQTQALPVVHLSTPGTARATQDAWYKAGVNSLVGRAADDEELGRKMRQLHDFWITVNEADRHSRV